MMVSWKIKLFAFFCAVLFVFSCILAYLNAIIRPILFAEAQAYLKTYLTDTISYALGNDELNSYFSETFSYTYKPDGSIAAYSSNMLAVNKIRSYLMADIIGKIKTEGTLSFEIPMGSLSGLPLLYGRGPDMSFILSPLFGVTCDIASEFSDSGINQTLHSLKLNISADTRIKEPLTNDILSIKTSALVSETVLMGDIPEAYTVIIRADEGDEDDINDYAASVD